MSRRNSTLRCMCGQVRLNFPQPAVLRRECCCVDCRKGLRLCIERGGPPVRSDCADHWSPPTDLLQCMMITERRRRELMRDGYGRRIWNAHQTQFCDGKNEAFCPFLNPDEAEPDRIALRQNLTMIRRVMAKEDEASTHIAHDLALGRMRNSVPIRRRAGSQI